jgi:hypothetical protein
MVRGAPDPRSAALVAAEYLTRVPAAGFFTESAIPKPQIAEEKKPSMDGKN